MRTTLLFFIVVVGASAHAGAGHLRRASLSTAKQNSQNYRGETYRLDATQNLSDEWELAASADVINREYRGNVRIHDEQAGFGATYKALANYYVETTATLATNADIYARYSLTATPHYAWGNSDVGFAMKYAEYKRLKAATFSPSYFQFLRDKSGVGVTAHVIRTENWISALQLQALIIPADLHLVRVTAAGGRALEDAGVETNFTSLTIQYAYEFITRWHIQLYYSNYASQTRDEQSAGLGLEFR